MRQRIHPQLRDMSSRHKQYRVVAMFLATVLTALPLFANDTLSWSPGSHAISADVKSTTVVAILEKVSAATGWQVFVEPEVAPRSVSAKFKDVPPGDALRLLLGDLNFALVPDTNATSRLFVFQTSRKNATQLVRAAKETDPDKEARPIPNELIVRLKPGAKIDDLARALGAKVIGRIDSLNAYRLQFEDAAAADAARTQLASNSEVESVDSNYSIERPNSPRELSASPMPPPRLQLNPPPDTGRIIVGLVDTAVQSLGNGLDQFILKQLSVAGQAQLDPNSPSHGTSMAETILRGLQATTQGATAVQILPVDVYGANPYTSTFDVAAGIVEAVNGGAKVVNLSLGSQGDSSFLHDIIKSASAKDILFLTAAGNEPVTTPYYPAAYPEVLAVTAVDRGQVASYANRGSFVSLGVPGSTVVYYNNQPYYVVGTSASAALTSGFAAGYMDSTRSTTAKAQTYLRDNFGFTPSPGK